jgi:hypothetical protein
MNNQNKMMKKTTTTNKFSQKVYLFDEEDWEFFLLLIHLDRSPSYKYFMRGLKYRGLTEDYIYKKYKNKDRYNWFYILYLKYKKIHGGFLEDWARNKLDEELKI